MNKIRYSPIGREDVWATKKWWPSHRQFAMVCSAVSVAVAVAEVNANITVTWANDTTAQHQIVFRKKLVQQMMYMYYKLTQSGVVRHYSSIRPRKRG